MQFKLSIVSAPSPLSPGSCQAVRIATLLARQSAPMTMTREESELKQLAYERERALRRKQLGGQVKAE
jgi:hypothetical protein